MTSQRRSLPVPFLRAIALSSVALSSFALTSCAGQVAPEGATFRVQFVDVRVTAVDEVRIRFSPQMAQQFMMRPTMSYEGITVSVEADGTLVMVVPGDYLRAHAVQTGTGDLSPQLDIEVWSDDDTMNAAPLVRVTALQGTETIAQGAGYVMAWPLALGSLSTVNVMCNMGGLMQCQRM